MEQLNRIIATLLLVFGVHSGNSMQLYRRIIRQYGHPPFEQIIIKPSYQLIYPHRPYHPIIKPDETSFHSNPHTYHNYDPSFSHQQQTLFHPISNPNLFQPTPVVQPPSTSPPPPEIPNYYPSNHYGNPYSKHKVQKTHFKPINQPQPIRYSKQKTKPNYEYHNPSHHYMPPLHHHHQRYQEEYHNDEDPPLVRQMANNPTPPVHYSGKETSTKHATNIKSVKMMPQQQQQQQQQDATSVKDEAEEPLDRPDVSKTTGPVFTYVKTDPNANIKWGVRHYVGNKYN